MASELRKAGRHHRRKPMLAQNNLHQT